MISEPGPLDRAVPRRRLRLDHVPRRGRRAADPARARADPRGRPVGGAVGQARDAARGARRLPRPARHRPRDDRRARVRRPVVHGRRRAREARAGAALARPAAARRRSRSTAAARPRPPRRIGRGGTDVIVAGSALYRADDMAAEVARIRSIADAARAATLAALGRGRVRALLQRVTRAEVRVDGAGRRSIGGGLLVLLGVGHGDDDATADAPRAPDLRAADLRGRGGPDEPVAARRRRRGACSCQPVHALRGHAPRPAARVHGRGAAGRSRRPSGCRVADAFARARASQVGLGEFGAAMAVELVNDGPFTIWLDTADRSG